MSCEVQNVCKIVSCFENLNRKIGTCNASFHILLSKRNMLSSLTKQSSLNQMQQINNSSCTLTNTWPIYQKFLPSSTFLIILIVLCRIESIIPATCKPKRKKKLVSTIETSKQLQKTKILTVKTPPIIAHTFVIKCEKDFGFSVIRTWLQKTKKEKM